MADTLGRISGQLLKADLFRDGQPLNFENGLLYLNTANGYVGINEENPFRDLFVNGTTVTTNLISTDGLAGISSLLISVSGNSITTANDLNLAASNYVFANIVTTDDIELTGNEISSLTENANIELRPNGTGTVDVYSDVEIPNQGNLYAQGDITLSGNLIIGNQPTDTVVFSSVINSDIVPLTSDTYSLGSNSSTGGNKWQGVWPLLLNGQTISTTAVGTGGTNLALRPGNILYVGTNGDNANEGDHQSAPYATIAHALSVATSGDVVYIYPGTYTEITPLVVPAGVHVKGMGLRSVTIVPDVSTDTETVFLLNGSTTVSDVTIKDFYAPGYAFEFNSSYIITSRSPYIQNVTVITKGSVTSASDPRGFDEGDAGGGAYVDGSVATTSDNISMLFHSVTFITPGVDALVMTNGVRVEWLNSFTYFANRGLYATNGTLGLANLAATAQVITGGTPGESWAAPRTLTLAGTLNGKSVYTYFDETLEWTGTYWKYWNSTIGSSAYYQSFDDTNYPWEASNWTAVGLLEPAPTFNTSVKFGAELRSISSANVYGTYGAVADGNSTLMYLINHNFAYIGAGKDVLNDETLNIAENETVELNSGKIYYQSLDNKGNFNVGDAFKVSFETGNATINGLVATASGNTSINFITEESETNINAELVSTGNLQFQGHTLSSYQGPVNLTAFTNEIAIPHDVNAEQDINITGDFNVDGTLTLGNQAIDLVEFDADIEFDLRPETTNTYNLGSSVKPWLVSYVRELDIGSTLTINGHLINGLATNADLELTPNGTGKVIASSNTVIENDLTVDLLTTVKNTAITGTIDLAGDINRTGNLNQTGVIGQTGNVEISSTAEFSDIQIDANTVTTISTDTDLTLKAAGTGEIYFPVDNVLVGQNVNVDDTITAGSVTVHGVTTANKFDNNDITIEDNIIQTTVGNNDLELGAATTGLVTANADSVEFNQDLTVLINTSLKNTIVGVGGLTPVPATIDLTGDYNQIGNVTLQTGNRSISSTLDVSSDAYFDDISFITNRVITDTADTDLSLKAIGTGKVVFNDNVTFSQAATIGIVESNGIGNSGTITSDIFTDNDIEIYDNIITTTVGNNNLILTANGTGGAKLEKVKFNSTTISTETTNEGIIFSAPASNLIITGTNALKIPVGTTANRTTLTQAELRFNTTDTLFRGFSTATVSFSGVYSANKLTNVLAHPTNNSLIFTTNSSSAMTISSSGITTSRVDTDNNLSISTNTISTLTTNSNIVLTPDGTGEVVIDDLSFGVSELTNLNASTPIIFQNTGTGYVEFSGTAGIVLPAGDNLSRPASPEVGDLRYNTQLSIAEVFNGVEYASLAGTGAELLSGEQVQELSSLMSLVFG